MKIENKVNLIVIVVLIIMAVLFAWVSDASAKMPDGEGLPAPDRSLPAKYVPRGPVTGRRLVLCEAEKDLSTDDWRPSGELVCPDPANPDFCYRDGGVK